MTHAAPATQRTLKAPISCVGTGLHSGARVAMRLLPAPPGHGVVFRRTDLDAALPARFDLVAETRLCTVLAAGTVRVGTVEHLLAALAGLGIDNALVEVDGPELPILDGSAQPFVFLIDCAGTQEQEAPRACIEVLRPVRVSDGAAWAELAPAAEGFTLDVSIDFPAPAIGRQAARHVMAEEAFRRDIAPARTFALLEEVEGMRRAGLARGGSLDNALVVDGARILNPCGLRLPEEFARHKLLDAVGDLALAGAPLRGRYAANRPGHALNNRLLHALFAAPDAWRWQPPAAGAARMGASAPGAEAA
jgi:UDP-3-O-[3-hydroxymyristoyl] N-acetylglucosamine deacetylase